MIRSLEELKTWLVVGVEYFAGYNSQKNNLTSKVILPDSTERDRENLMEAASPAELPGQS